MNSDSSTPDRQSAINAAQLADEASESGALPDELERKAGWQARLFAKLDERRTPALLFSVIIHTLLLLLLAVFTAVSQVGVGDSDPTVVSISTEESDQPHDLVTLPGADSAPTSSDTQTPIAPVATAAEDSRQTAQEIARLLTVGPQPLAQPTQSEAVDTFQQIMSATSNSLSASFLASGVSGRTPDQRQSRARQFGGSAESEQAVEDALKWLAAHQSPSGGWSLVHTGGKCDGRCANPGSKGRFDPAATGLSLLAFMGAGYTHESGKYQDTVNRGVYFLYQIMEDTPQGGSFLYTSDRGMYNHGIAAFALCEAYQMTLDKDLKDAAQKSIDFIVSAQAYSGGWGYLPKKPGDLTISGWQIMALKSAHSAGLFMPDNVTLRIDGFLDSKRLDDTFFYGYGKPDKQPTCSAIANMVRLFRGVSTSSPTILQAAEYFRDKGPSRDDVYYNYYGSLFLFHIGGPIWDQWNTPVRDYLVATQSKSGHEAGSWFFENQWGNEGGRLYTTAMAAMTLEVYYRFSPLYQQVDEAFEL